MHILESNDFNTYDQGRYSKVKYDVLFASENPLTVHSTLKRRAGYISFDPPSVQLLRLVYKIEFAPLYQSMKTKDQKLAEIKGLARRAAQRFFSVFIFLQFGGKNLLKKLCQ